MVACLNITPSVLARFFHREAQRLAKKEKLMSTYVLLEQYLVKNTLTQCISLTLHPQDADLNTTSDTLESSLKLLWRTVVGVLNALPIPTTLLKNKTRPCRIAKKNLSFLNSGDNDEVNHTHILDEKLHTVLTYPGANCWRATCPVDEFYIRMIMFFENMVLETRQSSEHVVLMCRLALVFYFTHYLVHAFNHYASSHLTSHVLRTLSHIPLDAANSLSAAGACNESMALYLEAIFEAKMDTTNEWHDGIDLIAATLSIKIEAEHKACYDAAFHCSNFAQTKSQALNILCKVVGSFFGHPVEASNDNETSRGNHGEGENAAQEETAEVDATTETAPEEATADTGTAESANVDNEGDAGETGADAADADDDGTAGETVADAADADAADAAAGTTEEATADTGRAESANVDNEGDAGETGADAADADAADAAAGTTEEATADTGRAESANVDNEGDAGETVADAADAADADTGTGTAGFAAGSHQSEAADDLIATGAFDEHDIRIFGLNNCIDMYTNRAAFVALQRKFSARRLRGMVRGSAAAPAPAPPAAAAPAAAAAAGGSAAGSAAAADDGSGVTGGDNEEDGVTAGDADEPDSESGTAADDGSGVTGGDADEPDSESGTAADDGSGVTGGDADKPDSESGTAAADDDGSGVTGGDADELDREGEHADAKKDAEDVGTDTNENEEGEEENEREEGGEEENEREEEAADTETAESKTVDNDPLVVARALKNAGKEESAIISLAQLKKAGSSTNTPPARKAKATAARRIKTSTKAAFPQKQPATVRDISSVKQWTKQKAWTHERLNWAQTRHFESDQALHFFCTHNVTHFAPISASNHTGRRR